MKRLLFNYGHARKLVHNLTVEQAERDTWAYTWHASNSGPFEGSWWRYSQIRRETVLYKVELVMWHAITACSYYGTGVLKSFKRAKESELPAITKSLERPTFPIVVTLSFRRYSFTTKCKHSLNYEQSSSSSQLPQIIHTKQH